MISNDDQLDAAKAVAKYLNEHDLRSEYISTYTAFVSGYLAALRNIDDVDVRIVCQNIQP